MGTATGTAGHKKGKFQLTQEQLHTSQKPRPQKKRKTKKQTMSVHEKSIQQLEQKCRVSKTNEQSVTTKVRAAENCISKMRWKEEENALQARVRGAEVVRENTAYFTPVGSRRLYTYKNIQRKEIRSQLQEKPSSDYSLTVIDAKFMTLVSTLPDCTSKGRKFRDDNSDFRLDIPEGAISIGKKLTVDIGVALFGPFQFPEGLRPMSPVFCVCVRDNRNCELSKPFTVTIPHFLDLESDDNIQSLGLSFLKADKMNSTGSYQFQPIEGEMDFTTFKTHGVLQISHFGLLCISGRKILPRNTQFCLTSILPRCLTQNSESIIGYFFITYFLVTCLKKMEGIIDKLIERKWYEIEKVPFKFLTETRDPALKMVFTKPECGRIGWKGKDTVCLYNVSKLLFSL